jgi:hypothetical protein
LNSSAGQRSQPATVAAAPWNGKKLSAIGIATSPAIETPSQANAPKVIASATRL